MNRRTARSVVSIRWARAGHPWAPPAHPGRSGHQAVPYQALGSPRSTDLQQKGCFEILADAMSEKVDLVRSIYVAWERGDFSAVAWADDDIEFAFVDGPDPGRWTGIEQMRKAWTRLLSDFVAFRTEATRYERLADGRIVALTRFVGRARGSGLDLSLMSTEQAAIFDVRDGKVTQPELYWDANHLPGRRGHVE